MITSPLLRLLFSSRMDVVPSSLEREKAIVIRYSIRRLASAISPRDVAG